MIPPYFKLFAFILVFLWAFFPFVRKIPQLKPLRLILFFCAAVSSIFYIAALWWHLGRPPLRTLGETRLWYATLLPIFAFLIDWRLKKTWMLDFCALFAAFFLVLNLLYPDNFDKSLVPALQSPWFVPHVMVYMLAYALLAATSFYAFRLLWEQIVSKQIESQQAFDQRLDDIDQFVWVGFGFLSCGLVFGAIWAKEAWGHYWTWDPKETWAFITWLAYLSYIHLRQHSHRPLAATWFLALSVLVLLCCWFGVNYLPSARLSVHTYSTQK